MYRLFLGCLIAASALLWSCVDINQEKRCTSDSQCRYGRICGEAGFCRAPDETPAPDAGPSPDTPPPAPQARLSATPTALTFERINNDDPAWRRAWREIELRNTGNAPLDIDNITIEGDPAFALDNSIEVRREWPSQLAPGETFVMRVWYYTEANEPVEARVIVESNDLRGAFEVPVSADPNPPCVQVEPQDRLVFEVAAPNQPLEKEITLTNCATESTLAIREVRMEVDAGGGFFVPEDELPGRLPEYSALVAPGESATIPVVYTGSSFAWNNGELVIETNVPEQRVIRMMLLRETSQNDCPIARAGGRTAEGNPFIASLRAATGATVELSAQNSIDPDGEVTEYRWTVVSRPEGSQAALMPNRELRDVRLRLDRAGQYLIELRVWDDAGAPSCGGVARVAVIAE